MATAPTRYAAAAATGTGRKRPTNEDAFGFSVEHGVYVVCDGMGGAAAGEVASSLAVAEVMRLLSERTVEEAAPLRDRITEAVCAANRVIYSRAQHDSNLAGMGTTLVGLATEGSRVLVFNVGDSRCYRMRSPGPDQLTPGKASQSKFRISQSKPGCNRSAWTTRWFRNRSGWAA